MCGLASCLNGLFRDTTVSDPMKAIKKDKRKEKKIVIKTFCLNTYRNKNERTLRRGNSKRNSISSNSGGVGIAAIGGEKKKIRWKQNTTMGVKSKNRIRMYPLIQ